MARLAKDKKRRVEEKEKEKLLAEKDRQEFEQSRKKEA
jgi:hypothetical protein